jgi:hypothetical protein
MACAQALAEACAYGCRSPRTYAWVFFEPPVMRGQLQCLERIDVQFIMDALGETRTYPRYRPE